MPPKPQMPMIPMRSRSTGRADRENRPLAEVLGVDVGRRDVATFAAAFADVGGVEGERDEAAFGHGLGVETCRLLLHGAERAGDGERRQAAVACGRRQVQIACQGDAVAVGEGDLLVLDPVALGKGLVPGRGVLGESRRGMKRSHTESCHAGPGQLQRFRRPMLKSARSAVELAVLCFVIVKAPDVLFRKRAEADGGAEPRAGMGNIEATA